MLETITEHAQRRISEALYISAATHAENSNGLFVAYEPDLNRFDYQSLSLNPSHFRLRGTPLDVKRSNDLAALIDSRYNGLPQAIVDYDKETGTVSQIGQVLKSGQNVILGAEHDEFLDVPLELVAMSNTLRQQEIAHRSAMVVSKSIDYLGVRLGAFGAPLEVMTDYLSQRGIPVEADATVTARNILRIAADRTYFTIPSSQTFAGIRKNQAEDGLAVKTYNSVVAQSIKFDMSRRGIRVHNPMLLQVALPGTVNKRLDQQAYLVAVELEGNFETIPADITLTSDKEVDVIGRISAGITTFTASGLLYAMALRLNQQPPRLAIDREFSCVESVSDINRIAGKLVLLGQGLEPDKQLVYDIKGNLPISRRA